MFIRLLLFFLLSLLPFWLMTESLKLNIYATLSCVFLAIWLIEKKRYIAVLFVFLIPFFIPMDYGWYGVAMITIAYLLRQSHGLNVSFINWNHVYICAANRHLDSTLCNYWIFNRTRFNEGPSTI
jgi:hypothetical protein